MIKKVVVLIGFIVVASLAVAGCTSPTSNTNTNTAPATNTSTTTSIAAATNASTASPQSTTQATAAAQQGQQQSAQQPVVVNAVRPTPKLSQWPTPSPSLDVRVVPPGTPVGGPAGATPPPNARATFVPGNPLG